MKIFFLFLLFSACNESPLLNPKKGLNNQRIVTPIKTWMKFSWRQDPKINENSPFDLTINEVLKPGENLEIELWMPSMGHGSSPVTITQMNEKEFFVDDVYFIMPGAWEVKIYKKQNGKIKNDFIIKLSL